MLGYFLKQCCFQAKHPELWLQAVHQPKWFIVRGWWSQQSYRANQTLESQHFIIRQESSQGDRYWGCWLGMEGDFRPIKQPHPSHNNVWHRKMFPSLLKLHLVCFTCEEAAVWPAGRGVKGDAHWSGSSEVWQVKATAITTTTTQQENHKRYHEHGPKSCHF